MRKTILQETEEVFILVTGYCSSSTAWAFSPQTKIEKKEGFGHSQSYTEVFGYDYFRSFGNDCRAIDDNVVWLKPTATEYRIDP